jgi:hypothetical protein
MLRHQPTFVVVIGFVLATLAGSIPIGVTATPPLSSPAAAVGRLTALPLVDRISLLLELPDKATSATHATDVSSEANAFVIDVGPLASTITSIDRTADAALPFVSRVSLRSSSNTSGQLFARIRVELRGRCQHSVRVSNGRLYIDIIPAAARQPLSAGAPPSKSPTPVAKLKDAPNPEPEMSYEALQADARRRAPLLARKPDVNGLLSLIAEIHRRDERLGKKRPDLIEPLIDEMNQALEEARALRLKMDAIELKKKQEEKR